MYQKFQLYIIILFFFFGKLNLIYSETQKDYFVDNLIEKNNDFFRPITNEKVLGQLFRSFRANSILVKIEFVGVVTRKGKNGHWTRWWLNGKKKSSGEFINSKKNGLWIEWREDGLIFSKMYYELGNLIKILNCIKEDCN